VRRRCPLGRDPRDAARRGFSTVESIRATVEILRLPLADAKRLVHESRAWADRRADDDRFHEVLEAEFRAEATGN
jgi:hypothetical protein